MADNSERTPLLNDGPNSGENQKPTWRHRLIYLAVFLIGFSVSLCNFVSNEWTHEKTKNDMFPNASLQLNTTCGETDETNPNYKKYQEVQRETARWSMKYSMAEYIPMLFMQLFLLSYSDVYGRKLMLVITLLSVCFKTTVVTILIGTKGSLWYIVGYNVIEGLMGGVFSLFVTIYSYLADITSEKKRSIELVILDAVALSAAVVGSLTTGYAVEAAKFGYFYTSLLSVCTCFGALLIIIFLLPESLPKNKRSQSKHLLSVMRRISDFYVSQDFYGRRLGYILLLMAYLFLAFSGMNRQSLEVNYLLGPGFCWTPKNIGHFMMLRSVAQGLIGLGSVKLLKMFMSDNSIGVLAMASCTFSLILESFATSSVVMLMVPVVGMFAFLVVPMIRGMMSSMTSQDRQGALFTSVALIEVLSTILSSVSENWVYTVTLSFMNGFVFIVLAVFAFLSMCMLILFKCSQGDHDTSSNQRPANRRDFLDSINSINTTDSLLTQTN